MAGYPGSQLAWGPAVEWSVSGSGRAERLEAEIGFLMCWTTCGAGGPAPPAVKSVERVESAESEGGTAGAAGAGAAIQVARIAAPSRPRRFFLHRCVVTQGF
ncbi:hypothetical protein ABZ260_36530 [Streptosporangium sp. NPDC006013]|uniref:hypothetical protein n=1 Tax=Streptosporangium sp. NPDC006013 TaxID=3155596 RepID=UPI0033BEE665